jgi:transposase
MNKERRHFTPEQKVKILREHLLEDVPISQVCAKHQIQPTLFYLWQKVFFENGHAAFQAGHNGRTQAGAEQKKIDKLQARLQRKDEVMAELLTEHILLKKSLGEN